jgi:7-keto-8-aminopelargonate synthetase-like enzyme
MTLVKMLETNANARKVFDELNEAEIMSAFNLTLSQVKEYKHLNSLLIMNFDCEDIVE